jgi:hypothetical protein
MAVALCLGAAAPLATQQNPGPYIPLGSPLDRLTLWAAETGALPALDPAARPFALRRVAEAVARADSAGLSAGQRRALRWLLAALPFADDTVAVTLEAGLRSYTHGGRDAFRPIGGEGVTGSLLGRVVLGTGNLAAVWSGGFDNSLRDDPEFTGYRGRSLIAHIPEAYLSFTSAHVDLLFGRIARSWGPALFPGPLVSAVARPVESFGATLRYGRFELATFSSRLDDADSTAAVPIQRWLFAHRLGVDAGRGVRVAVTQTGVYGGRGSGFDPALATPLGLAYLTQHNDGRAVNVQMGLDVSLPVAAVTRLAVSGFLDDMQVDDSLLTDQRPTAYGAEVVLTHALVPGTLHVSAGYARISALAYRNSTNPEFGLTLRGIGLGHNYSDYDQVLVRGEWRPGLRWALTGELSYLRQGAADFRQPFPPDSVLAQPGQGFLVAPVTQATGVALGTRTEFSSTVSLVNALGITQDRFGRTVAIASTTLRALVRFL